MQICLDPEIWLLLNIFLERAFSGDKISLKRLTCISDHFQMYRQQVSMNLLLLINI